MRQVVEVIRSHDLSIVKNINYPERAVLPSCGALRLNVYLFIVLVSSGQTSTTRCRAPLKLIGTVTCCNLHISEIIECDVDQIPTRTVTMSMTASSALA